MMDVDLIGRTLQVNAESAKNPARARTIPLTNDALWAATSLVSWGRGLGCTAPHHFLLSYRHGSVLQDPNRHISDNGLQKHWHDLRNAAGMPWLTGHVLRYQCITKMAEGNVDRITANRVAGHIMDKMWDKYSLVRLESIREKMADAFDISGHRRDAASARPLSQDTGKATAPAKPAAPKIDLADPAIHAEILRIAHKVAGELERERQAKDAKGGRVITFPGAG